MSVIEYCITHLGSELDIANEESRLRWETHTSVGWEGGDSHAELHEGWKRITNWRLVHSKIIEGTASARTPKKNGNLNLKGYPNHNNSP